MLDINQFFTQMITTLNAIMEQLANGDLSSIEWGDKNINIIKNQDVLFVATSDLEAKQKKVNEELKKLSNRFFDIYSMVLIEEFSTAGDRNIFLNSEQRFKEAIKEVLK